MPLAGNEGVALDLRHPGGQRDRINYGGVLCRLLELRAREPGFRKRL